MLKKIYYIVTGVYHTYNTTKEFAFGELIYECFMEYEEFEIFAPFLKGADELIDILVKPDNKYRCMEIDIKTLSRKQYRRAYEVLLTDLLAIHVCLYKSTSYTLDLQTAYKKKFSRNIVDSDSYTFIKNDENFTLCQLSQQTWKKLIEIFKYKSESEIIDYIPFNIKILQCYSSILKNIELNLDLVKVSPSLDLYLNSPEYYALNRARIHGE